MAQETGISWFRVEGVGSRSGISKVFLCNINISLKERTHMSLNKISFFFFLKYVGIQHYFQKKKKKKAIFLHIKSMLKDNPS